MIVVVSHNGFLRHLLGNELWSSGGRTPAGFSNGEARRLVMSDEGELRSGGISVRVRNTVADEVARVGYLD